MLSSLLEFSSRGACKVSLHGPLLRSKDLWIHCEATGAGIRVQLSRWTRVPVNWPTHAGENHSGFHKRHYSNKIQHLAKIVWFEKTEWRLGRHNRTSVLYFQKAQSRPPANSYRPVHKAPFSEDSERETGPVNCAFWCRLQMRLSKCCMSFVRKSLSHSVSRPSVRMHYGE